MTNEREVLREEKLTEDGGVVKRVYREGAGEERPGRGDKVYVHYVGTLQSDGSKFDSSRDRGDHFTFDLGVGRVIKGWDIGVASMRKGELCDLVCTADYAYGASGAGPKIPGGATLNFEVELFSWDDMSVQKVRRPGQPGEVKKKVLRDGGDEAVRPGESAAVRVAVAGWHGETEFQRETVELVLDESEGVLLDALLDVVRGMTENEKCKVWVSAAAAYGAAGDAARGVPADADLVFEVSLESVTNPPNPRDLPAPERLAAAQRAKTVGSAAFGKGQLNVARKQYVKACDALHFEESDEGADEAVLRDADALRLVLFNNLAAVCIKERKYADAVAQANMALEVDPKSVKALFRRGQAERLRLNFKAASKDLLAAAKLEPNNAAVRAEYGKCREAIEAAKSKEKATYGGMFTKMALFTDEEIAARKKAAAHDPMATSDSDDDGLDDDAEPDTTVIPGIRTVEESGAAGVGAEAEAAEPVVAR